MRVGGYSSSVGVLRPDWVPGSLESNSGGTGEDGGSEGGDDGRGEDAVERGGECSDWGEDTVEREGERRDRGGDDWGDCGDDGRP